MVTSLFGTMSTSLLLFSRMVCISVNATTFEHVFFVILIIKLPRLLNNFNVSHLDQQCILAILLCVCQVLYPNKCNLYFSIHSIQLPREPVACVNTGIDIEVPHMLSCCVHGSPPPKKKEKKIWQYRLRELYSDSCLDCLLHLLYKA